jgi:hypothetical protein
MPLLLAVIILDVFWARQAYKHVLAIRRTALLHVKALFVSSFSFCYKTKKKKKRENNVQNQEDKRTRQDGQVIFLETRGDPRRANPNRKKKVRNNQSVVCIGRAQRERC